MITFAVIGRDEVATLANALGQAKRAAGRDDRVIFVDGASTDGSPALARALGVEVVSAPEGKGRAVAAAAAVCEGGRLCLLDADIVSSDVNIPLALREALEDEDADMLVGEFDWPQKRVVETTCAIYRPLVNALFPEAAGRYGRMELGGFRIVDLSRPLGSLPAGFGVEAHLNVAFAAEGRRTATVELGRYTGPVRFKPRLGVAVATAILDLAEAHGRLDASARPLWERWVEETMSVIGTQPADGAALGDYPQRLAVAAARPLPPRWLPS